MRACATFTAACVLGVLGLMSPPTAAAADLVILTNQGATPGVKELAAAFARASGHKVTVIQVEGDALQQRISSGSADLVTGNPETIEPLVRNGAVVASTVTPFVLAGLGLSVRAGAPKPDISTVDAYKAALLAAKSIGYSRGCSGTHIAEGIAQLGLTEQLKAKTTFTTGGPVTDFLARGDFEIGIQQTNIMVGVPGTDYVGPLPGFLNTPCPSSVALLTASKEPAAAREMIRFMVSAEAAPLLRKTHVEPANATGAAGQAPAPAPGDRADRLRRETNNAALQNIAPFKVFDNLYYVGVGYVGSWLVTTNQGLILIDTLEGAYKERPIENIRTLGFDPRDIKYVILTHYHLDHTAGAARIQEAFGARLAMGEADWAALAQAPNPNNERLPRRDIAVKDGDTIKLGSTTITLHVLGGHTPATLGVDFTVYDGRTPYRAFMFGGAAPGPGRQLAEQFLASVKRIKQMQDGIQARIVTHAWMDPQFWDRTDRLAARKPGDPHPFVAPDVFRAWIAELEGTATARLNEASASPGGQR